MADILLLEDDEEYVQAVRDHISALKNPAILSLHHARDIPAALAVCRDRDVRVAIIDLSLPNGTLGTDAISAIYEFDKKVIFIIHTVHGPQAIADWCARIGVPYTSQFFLQKTGSSGVPADAGALCELTVKALRSYVPYIPPVLMSVRDVMEIIDGFSEDHPSFRRNSIVRNILLSQDVLNAASQWAADRLARTGYDSTRIAVAMTGSFARLEATKFSDADYFIVFDDLGLPARERADLINVTFYAFLEVGAWFDRNGVEVHGHQADEKRPDRISWHDTTLPTWFPLSSLLAARLGRSTQLELTKQWFLFESFPIFNAPLLHDIRRTVASQMGAFSQPTVRDGIAHSSLAESFQLLTEEFEYAFRNKRRDSLMMVKHYFMRLLNLFSIRLWLIRCFLDPAVFESPPDRLFGELPPHPLARVIQFHGFLRQGTILQGKHLKQSLSDLEVICNLYAEAAQSFGSKTFREEPRSPADYLLINDLAETGQRCQTSILAVLKRLAEAPSVATHLEIALRRIL
jgi:hypothetical protein